MHEATMYVTILKWDANGKNYLTYGILSKYYYEDIYNYVRHQYPECTCNESSFEYMPIFYSDPNCISTIRAIVNDVCIHDGLTCVSDNLFDASDMRVMYLAFQHILKLFGRNDLESSTDVMRCITAQHDPKLESAIIRKEIRNQNRFAKNNLEKDVYAAEQIAEMQKYLIHVPSRSPIGWAFIPDGLTYMDLMN